MEGWQIMWNSINLHTSNYDFNMSLKICMQAVVSASSFEQYYFLYERFDLYELKLGCPFLACKHVCIKVWQSQNHIKDMWQTAACHKCNTQHVKSCPYESLMYLKLLYTSVQGIWWGGGCILNSLYPTVWPSICRWHSFQSATQVCFGILITNFTCMLFVAMPRRLLIFSNVKLAAWRWADNRVAYNSTKNYCKLFNKPNSHWTVKHWQSCWLKLVIKLISHMLI